MSSKILIVEDDPEIRRILSDNLQSNGYQVEAKEDGVAGLQSAQQSEYDLLILDIMLPGMSGQDICREIRKTDEDTPILMLTAKTGEIDTVLGLELGADDYVTKPFSMHEVLARIKALLRRAERRNKYSENRLLQIAGLTIDLDRVVVSLDDTPLPLTPIEFELLAYLAQHPGKTLSRTVLARQVLGYEGGEYEKTITTHISRLRQKLEPTPESTKYLLTVRGVGYRVLTEEELAEQQGEQN